MINIYFKEHLSDDGHNRWPKHVLGYALYNTMNLHIGIRNWWLYFSQWIISAWSWI